MVARPLHVIPPDPHPPLDRSELLRIIVRARAGMEITQTSLETLLAALLMRKAQRRYRDNATV